MAMQTDGYNVYMYLDDELIDCEHLCCMAHARAKFFYAWQINKEPDAKFILELIARLYALEKHYDKLKLSPKEIIYGSDRMANVSALYHTLFSTCKQMKASASEYFGKLFDKVVRGCTDMVDMLPMNIGLSVNKY